MTLTHQPLQAATAVAWAELHTAACAPYQKISRWAWHWARGKLAMDPVFRGLLERGDLRANARVLDIGCGQGLLASLLHACAVMQRSGHWPAAWPVQPSALAYTGIELMQRDVARADQALRGLAPQPRFVCADMREAPFAACDLVVILDVLHYVDHAAQEAVLRRVRSALAQSKSASKSALKSPSQSQSPLHAPSRPGRLLLRVGDAASTRGFATSQWVDRLVTWARGHRVPPTFSRTLAQWTALLQGLGFSVHAVPQSQGTPFANVLLVADLQPGLEGSAA